MISIKQTNHLKTIAILMMLCLHLFNTLDYKGLFLPLLFIGSKPFIYYISLFCDACVPIFAFVSGYGLYFKYQQNSSIYLRGNLERLKKLYINYWIIILIFPLGLGFLLNEEGYPGTLINLLGNLTGFVTTYNGAWWFFTIYILFILTSPFWFKLINKINPYLYFCILLLVYIVSFYFRVYHPANSDNIYFNWLQTEIVLYGCTLFQFMLGAFTLHFFWSTKFTSFCFRVPYKIVMFFLGLILLIIIRGFLPNFFFAPFTGLTFVFLFLEVNWNYSFCKIADFFTPHTTNIWLVHMFFYMVFFKDFIYSAKYIIPIFVLLVLCCICSSIVINKVNSFILKHI